VNRFKNNETLQNSRKNKRADNTMAKITKDKKTDNGLQNTTQTRNVCITKYARLYKLSNGTMVMTPK
jgi:hypothetical protein